MLVFQGNCYEQDQNFPFSVWIEGLRSWLSSVTDRGFFQEAFAPFASDFVKLLPEIVEQIPDVVPSPALDSEAEKRRLFETWAKFFIRVSQDRPLLILLEDLHWSDDVSLELLQFLSRRIGSQPILLLATYRDEEMTPRLQHILAQFDRQRLARELHLERLNPGESSLMIRTILQNERSIKRDMLDRILSHAEGNPFYIEELVKLLRDQKENERGVHPPIPRSLRDTIQQRTKSLSSDAKRLLIFAAVIGERFSFKILSQLTDVSESDLLLQLHELITAFLIVETSPGEFSFRHALIREAMNASLLVLERQDLHGKVANTIENLSPERHENYLSDLAYHYYEAGAWEKAMKYGEMAGKNAMSLAAMREARIHLDRAIDAAHHLSLQPSWQLLLARGKAYDRLGESELARLDLTSALDQARLEQDSKGESEALISLGYFFSAQDYKQTIDYFRQALQVARSIQEPALIGAILNRIGNWFVNQERPLEGGQYHQEALEIYEEFQDTKGIASTLELTAMQLYFVGDHLLGSQTNEKALSLFRSLGDREGIYYCLCNSILTYGFDTDITPLLGARALSERGEEALQIARSIGWRSGEGDALHVIAWAARAAGNYDLALRYERLAVSILEEIDQRTSLARALMNLSMVHLELLALEDAIQIAERALRLARDTGSPSMAMIIISTLALACIERNQQGDREQANKLLQSIIQSLPIQTRHERYGWMAKARLALASGEAGEALEIADALLAATRHIDEYGPQGVPRIAHLRGDALASLGEADDARSMYTAARQGAIQQGRGGILWRILLSSGKLAVLQKQWGEAEAAFAETRRLLSELAEPISDERIRASFLERSLARIPEIPAAGSRKAAKQAFGNLTAREREVADLIAEGRSNREIAEKLFITERTAERHVSNILLKLNFHSRGQIAEWVSGR